MKLNFYPSLDSWSSCKSPRTWPGCQRAVEQGAWSTNADGGCWSYLATMLIFNAAATALRPNLQRQRESIISITIHYIDANPKYWCKPYEYTCEILVICVDYGRFDPVITAFRRYQTLWYLLDDMKVREHQDDHLKDAAFMEYLIKGCLLLQRPHFLGKARF